MWRIGLRMLSMRKSLKFPYSKLIIFKAKHQTRFFREKSGGKQGRKKWFLRPVVAERTYCDRSTHENDWKQKYTVLPLREGGLRGPQPYHFFRLSAPLRGRQPSPFWCLFKLNKRVKISVCTSGIQV